MSIPALRPYQREAIDAVIAARRAGIRRMVVCLPTGAGKTVIFSHLARLPTSRCSCSRIARRFCSMDGEMLSPGELKWPLWRSCKKAGLRFVGWHLAMRGARLKAIQELLGHATIMMTMRYAHLAPEVAARSRLPTRWSSATVAKPWQKTRKIELSN